MVSKKRLLSIVKAIRAFCEANADENQAQRYARYFTEGYDAYGIHQEAFVNQKEKLLQAYRDELGLADVLRLGELLLESGKYEEASFAVHFAEAYKDQFTEESFQPLGQWLETGIRNWGHTDVFCSIVLSPFLEQDLVKLPAMARWRESSSKWKRRAVPVTMLCLLKTEASVKPLLTFIDPMMLDEDRFVQQGLGWFLREVWKKDPKPVETFLLKWKDEAPRKIFQYATEKMSKKERGRYRRQRKQ